MRLLFDGETLQDLLRLPPEKLLMRWFNYQLQQASSSTRVTNCGADRYIPLHTVTYRYTPLQAGSSTRVTNWGADLQNSVAYATLLKQIDPQKQAATAPHTPAILPSTSHRYMPSHAVTGHD